MMYALHSRWLGSSVALVMAAACLLSFSFGASAAEPRVLDERYELELFAADPDIVTPVGATFNARGQLLVIESHTHFPHQEYEGPKHDRIRLIEDTDADGRADRFRSFYEGTHATMSLRRGPADWIYVATRKEIFRLRDSDGDDVADVREEIARLETSGNYPHNGLGGLAFDAHGHLYFGLGENLGEPYELIAADGSRWKAGGEGGNVFRCSVDGRQLTRVATGFWNPFGICVDRHDRVFAVGNDPDGCPPCRLVHVVPTGDFGYQFRYGRSGKHPLQAWDGELPGTLPMVAGTGEAPCAVLPFDGRLWVTSWGENRLERFDLRHARASFTANRDIVVQGDHNFRPVDFAVAPDGSLYFTDWVDRSYPVHGHGRIWRLKRKANQKFDADWPELCDAEQRARRDDLATDRSALSTDDVFLRQAAVADLVRAHQTGKLSLAAIDLSEYDAPLARLSVVQAARWVNQPESILAAALRDADERLRLTAVRWVADEKLKQYEPQLIRLLDDPRTSPRLFAAVVAALDWLERGQVSRQYRHDYDRRLAPILRDEQKSAAIRATALRLLSVDSPAVSIEELAKLARADDSAIAREATRLLVLRGGEPAVNQLVELATDNKLSAELRADAVVGLASAAERHRETAARLADNDAAQVAREAKRVLRTTQDSPPNGAASNDSPDRPAAADVDAWLARVQDGGDANAGWRVFFSAAGGRCAACHTLDGRGAAIGPDLTRIGNRMGKRRVLESILHPSREIAPTYQPFVIEMADGRTFSGLTLGRFDGDKKERIVGADGREITLDVPNIERRTESKLSIMPQGLEQGLSDQDLRDLLALLSRNE